MAAAGTKTPLLVPFGLLAIRTQFLMSSSGRTLVDVLRLLDEALYPVLGNRIDPDML